MSRFDVLILKLEYLNGELSSISEKIEELGVKVEDCNSVNCETSDRLSVLRDELEAKSLISSDSKYAEIEEEVVGLELLNHELNKDLELVGKLISDPKFYAYVKVAHAQECKNYEDEKPSVNLRGYYEEYYNKSLLPHKNTGENK